MQQAGQGSALFVGIEDTQRLNVTTPKRTRRTTNVGIAARKDTGNENVPNYKSQVSGRQWAMKRQGEHRSLTLPSPMRFFDLIASTPQWMVSSDF